MTAPRSLAALVDHQVRRWEIQQRAALPQRPEPCVALSRLPGSGARELGLRVCERLDYGFFDIEIVDRIACEQQVRRDLVAGLDEHVRSSIDRMVIDWFQKRAFTESDYARQVVHTLTTLGERGMAVILGRGAPFVLPAECCLRVLVVAEREQRARRLGREFGIPADEAERRLDKADRERLAFLRHTFDVDPDEATRYDLVLNTSALGVDVAADLVVEALRRRFPAAD